MSREEYLEERFSLVTDRIFEINDEEKLPEHADSFNKEKSAKTLRKRGDRRRSEEHTSELQSQR